MAERVETVRLMAEVSNYVAGMEKMQRATSAASDDAQAKLSAQRAAFTELGTAALAVGAVAAAGVALAVARFAEFDAAMSNVKAVTQETSSNMGLLRDAALEFGASSVFTATEAAGAIEELGKAGLSTADILGGALEGALNLASAGELEIARAAEIASTTLSQFGLAGDQASRVADTLAAGAGKALGSVDDLANGLKFVGPVAASMGVSLEETTGVLALFAQQGIIGEQAGTSLRGMLSSLTSPSKQASAEIEALGITLYDGEGKFLGLSNAAGELEKAYGPMTDAQRDASLGVLFGNQQVTAARVLYQDGAKGVDEWTGAVSESGYAAQIANDRLDNLKGDVEALGGAFDTFLIKSGSGANDILRSLVQTLTFLVDGMGQLPDPVLNAGLAIGVVTAAVGLAGGGAMIALPKIVALKGAMATLGISAGGAARSVALAGGAIAGATMVIGFFVGRAAQAAANTTELADSLDAATGATTKYTRELVARKLAESGAFEAAKEAGVGQKELTDAVLEGGDALDKIKQKLTDNNTIGTFFTGVGIRAGNARMEITDLANSVEDSAEQFDDQKAAGVGAADATLVAGEAYKAAADEASQLNDNLMSLIETMNEANGMGRDAVSTNADYQESLAGIREYISQAQAGVEGFALGMDQSTVAGSANADMLAEFAAKAEAASVAQLALDGDVAAYMARAAESNRITGESAAALGMGADEAQVFADKVAGIPTAAEVQVTVDTAAAARQLENFITTASGRKIYVGVLTDTPENVAKYGRAEGGPIWGVGGPKQDNIPIMASVGEHMLDAEDVQRMGGHAGVYRFRESLYRGYADGGAIQYAPPSYAGSGGSAGGIAQVSLAGATLLMSVDGRQMSAVIQEQIVDNSRVQSLRVSNGSTKGRH